MYLSDLQHFFAFFFLGLLSRWQRDLTRQLTWRWLIRQRGVCGSCGSLEMSTTAPHRVRKYWKASIFHEILCFLKFSPFKKKIFFRVPDPVWGSAPPARDLDQPDRGCRYLHHSPAEPVPTRLLLLQSPGHESPRLQRPEPTFQPVQDQPCRWTSRNKGKFLKICKKKKKAKKQQYRYF